MTLEQEAKLKQFAHDVSMYDAVYDALLKSFLKPRKDADVYTLAASRLSIDFLNDAFRQIESMRERENSTQKIGQVGL